MMMAVQVVGKRMVAMNKSKYFSISGWKQQKKFPQNQTQIWTFLIP